MSQQLFLLFEAASGYGLFEVVEADQIASQTKEIQSAISDLTRFSKIVKLKGFQAFTSAEGALQNINDISEGIVSDELKNFLELNLPKVKAGKKPKFSVGVSDHKIGTAVQEVVGVPCKCDETILELLRGVRMHFDRYVKGLEGGAMEQAQLGLAHSYSRAKVKFNVNRSDNMIIQAICLLDQLDKDVNTFAMRVREWYSWHFPELAKIVKENYMYARIAHLIGNRATLKDEHLEKIKEITMDEDLAKEVMDAAKASMGMDMGEVDLINVKNFTSRLVSLAEYRARLHQYLVEKMSVVAPNLSSLIGEMVGARLISHAGSLTNLAKCPASTVQILGAEKALFRALKTRGNTPKYGLIFHSTFIGRAGTKNKGRISRYLANKCSIASRIDSFSELATTKFGEKLRQQVEERLAFYESGATPQRNLDAMRTVVDEVKPMMDKAMAEAGITNESEDLKTPTKSSKKDKSKSSKKSEKKSAKKEKKSKKRSRDEEEEEVEASPEPKSAEKSAKKARKEKKAKKAKKNKD